MKKIALAAAALMAISGSAFAANSDHEVDNASALSQPGIDYGTTASVNTDVSADQHRPTSQDAQQHRVDGNPNTF